MLRSKLVASFVLAATVTVACRRSHHANRRVAWQPPVEIANGGGTKGPWQQNESDFDYVDDPSVALADDGTTAVVWVDHRDKDVHYQRFAADGTRRGPAVNISRTPAVFSWLPRILVASRRGAPADIFVVWQEIIFSGGSHGGDILFARSRDGGATFSAPHNLSRSLGGDGKGRIDAKTWHNGSLDLARAPDGTLHVAWTEYDGPLWLTSSRDGGSTFAAPAQIAGTRERPARAPSLAAADGAVYLAWTHGEDVAADIHLAVLRPDARDAAAPSLADTAAPKVDDADADADADAAAPRSDVGARRVEAQDVVARRVDAQDVVARRVDAQDVVARRVDTPNVVARRVDTPDVVARRVDAPDVVARRVAAPIVVARTPTYADAPKLALAGDTLHLTYAETSGGPFEPARIMYTRMQVAASAPAAPTSTSTSVPPSTSARAAFQPPRPIGTGSFPSLDVHGARVTILWEDAATADRARGLRYAMSTDGGRTFAAPDAVDGSRDPDGGLNGSHQGRLMKKLVTKGGTIAVVNSALAHGRGSRVWLIRGQLRTAR